jgi:hemin uptake protein HemP
MAHENEAATSTDSARRAATAAPVVRDILRRRVTSADLFAGGRELEIDHNGRRYQLRITQTGKLILTA